MTVQEDMLHSMVSEVMWGTLIAFITGAAIALAIASGQWWLVPFEVLTLLGSLRNRLIRIARRIRQVFV